MHNNALASLQILIICFMHDISMVYIIYIAFVATRIQWGRV